MVVASSVLPWSGCGGAPKPVADPEVVARQQERLLEPFQTERTIVADKFDVLMTANFNQELAIPSLVAGMQEEERIAREDGGSEVVYRNRTPANQLEFSIGATRIIVLREARIAVIGGRSDYRLEAVFEGGVTAENVSVVEAGVRTDVRGIRVADGILRRLP